MRAVISPGLPDVAADQREQRNERGLQDVHQRPMRETRLHDRVDDGKSIADVADQARNRLFQQRRGDTAGEELFGFVQQALATIGTIGELLRVEPADQRMILTTAGELAGLLDDGGGFLVREGLAEGGEVERGGVFGADQIDAGKVRNRKRLLESCGVVSA